MSKLFDFTGTDDFFYGGPMYSNPKDSSFILSVGQHVDVYFPPSKRSRVRAPIVLSGERFELKKEASIEVLPDECLFEILRRLPGDERSNCASVSKRWLSLLSTICRDEICDKEVRESMSDEDQNDECGGYLSRKLVGKKATDVRLAAIAVGAASRGGLCKLSICGSNPTRGVTDVGLRAIARGCPSLRVLSLWDLPFVSDDGLLEIGNGCHLLQKIDLCNCPGITGKGLLALARNCPKLMEISIERCSNIGNEGLQAVGQYCPNLKIVSIKDCPAVGDQGIAGLVSSAACVLTKLNLQALNITDVSLAVIGHYGMAVTDLTFANLPNVSERGFWVLGKGHGLQKLKSFTVTSCQGVTNAGLEAVGKGCPNLRQLCLHGCSFLSDGGLISFAKAALSIESLLLEECHRITQIGLLGLLFSCCAKLKSLSLVKCLGIRDTEWGLKVPLSCQSLRTLCIRNCPGFGDASLAFLGKLCPQLQNLELSGLQAVTDSGLLPIVKGSEAGLVKVNLSHCINLSDNVVSTMTELHGWTLEVLNLDGCVKITDASLASIADNCLLLSDLDISKTAITDAGIYGLAQSSCLNLQILSLSGCFMISEKCLPAITKLGRSLFGLNLQQCNSISRSSIDVLVEQLWRCDILS